MNYIEAKCNALQLKAIKCCCREVGGKACGPLLLHYYITEHYSPPVLHYTVTGAVQYSGVNCRRVYQWGGVVEYLIQESTVQYLVKCSTVLYSIWKH